jgi:hypothetical protein
LSDQAIIEFKQNGFYSDYLRLSDGTLMNKVKVVAVNMQANYMLNLYLITNRNDPGGVLAWLERTL